MQNYLKCIMEIRKYDSAITSAPMDKKYEILKDVYAYLKSCSPDLVRTKKEIEDFATITYSVFKMSERIPNESLISIKPYDFSKEVILRDGADAEAILNYIVDKARRKLLATNKGKGQAFQNCDFMDECQDNALYVHNLALKMGFPAALRIVEPGYVYDSKLCQGGCKHCFVVIYICGKTYIIDCTYSQFFFIKRCLIERTGIVFMPSCNPGLFMTMDESRRKTAETLLNNGWMELTDENIKNYFDGFSIYFRNGLYYEITNDFSYTTPYTVNNYVDFLNHTDDQTKHEPLEGLGYQYRVLRNPKMSFEKR